MKKIALVTGANRGIGLEVAKELAQKEFTVILTARDPKKSESVVKKLKDSGLDVHFHSLDVTSAESIKSVIKYVEKEFKRLDVLVNNAGIYPDKDFSQSPFETTIETIKKGFETNLFGPILLCQSAIPLMRKNKFGRIINLSSGMGQLSEMEGGSLAYRLSKTALNVVTKVFSAEVSEDNILINSVCPGWVKTDMGGAGADRSVEEGADTIVWLASQPNGSTNGGFFRDRETIPW